MPEMTTFIEETEQRTEGEMDAPRGGIKVKRLFTEAGEDVHGLIPYEERDARILGADGETVFEQEGVEVPADWSQMAVNVVASKYFRGVLGTSARERGVRQLVDRVAGTVSDWALADGYLETEEDRDAFRDELTYILVTQRAAFNSPVWFNVGVEEHPQCSACFINSVEDTLESIMDLAKTEGMIFKYGSGAGINLSRIRGKDESLSGGGTASGPISFMKGYDAFAGVIKSGGKTRRAAKIVLLNADHPDVFDFVTCKRVEEEKAHALLDVGYDDGLDGSAYASVFFQNANHSVRVTDEFMAAATTGNGAMWDLRARKTREVTRSVRAAELLDVIAETAWACGDPGLQFDDAANRWHTCPEDGRINASNPCCFTGSTLVDTSEGRYRIKELAEMSDRGENLPHALSFDPESRIPVARPIIRAWCAGKTTTLVRVRTRRGLVFESTPEHGYYLQDGRRRQAKDLSPGDRLQKLAVGRNKYRGNRRVILHRPTEEFPNGCESYARWLYREINGEIPEGMEVHHRNEDKTDDRISNYVLRESSVYRSAHSSGEGNSRYLDVPVEALVEVWEDEVVESVEVITLGNPVRVYDLEVDGTHRFGIANDGFDHAVIVSNSEFMFLDDSACNLASLNLRKFQRADGELQIEEFVHAVGVLILAQEVLVDRARYPTEAIDRNSKRFRPLGLGYANLGAFLMARGLPYDSDAGRAYAAALTALMTGVAYYKSAAVARVKGPFDGYSDNAGAMLNVLEQHAEALGGIDIAYVPMELLDATFTAFSGALFHGGRYGFRNAQVTLLAPTGTIAFMMDCDTTGIEPDISLLKRKLLVGGGEMTYENGSVDRALRHLGYDGDEIGSAVLHLRRTGTFAGSCVRKEHLPVFDCALPDGDGRLIGWEGHVRMVGAVQPFLSGAVSKTVNLPEEATVQDVRDVYVLAWKLGLKAISIYRDNSKRIQPLKRTIAPAPNSAGRRERLPETRGSVTHKIDIGGHEGYVTAGYYPDGRLGELFVVMAKSGSTVSGLLDAWATAVSIALQYGVPYSVLREKFERTRFDPSGFTQLGMSTSVLDYLFRWLEEEFPGGRRAAGWDEVEFPPERTPIRVSSMEELSSKVFDSGPPCAICGSIMEPNGTCHRCPTCGTTNGCG